MTNKNYEKEIRCPIHNCIIGKYDVRYGVKNVVLFCHKCKKEYTISQEASIKKI